MNASLLKLVLVVLTLLCWSGDARAGLRVAEEEVHLVVPGVYEGMAYDAAGRLEEDAFWSYSWDGPGRLRMMTRKPGTLADPDAEGQVVVFTCDADGRRTGKISTTSYPQNQTVVHQSQVLWAGWLPVLEERIKDGQSLGRRWFQWGADLSGTLEGAGGIGGLRRSSRRMRRFHE